MGKLSFFKFLCSIFPTPTEGVWLVIAVLFAGIFLVIAINTIKKESEMHSWAMFTLSMIIFVGVMVYVIYF